MSERLRFEIGADLKPLERALNEASGKIKKFADDNREKFETFGKSMVNIGNQFKFVSLAALGLGAASIKMASDFEESMNKVDVAFGHSANVVKEFAKTSLEMFGISEGTALDMAALFGDMATSMGLPQQQAALMSKELVGLAGDLASFKNIGIAQATTALNGVFTGETESLKMLGIVMTEANLQQFAYAEGISKTVQQMTQAEKVQLRYNYILNNTKNAQGDFARTGGGAANQMRVFTERLKEISTQLGSILLPYFTKLITYVNGLVKGFQEMNPIVQKVVVVVGLLVAAFAPLMVIVGSIISFLPQIIAGFAALTGPIGLIVLGVVALTAAVVANWGTVKQWAQDVINYFIKLYNESFVFRMGIEYLMFSFKNLYEVVKFVVVSIYNVITTVFKNIYEAIKGVAQLIFSVLTFDLDGIKTALSKTFNAVTGNVSKLFTDISNDAKALFGNIRDNAADAVKNTLTGQLKEVDFTTKKESTEKLKTDVTNAVSEGITNGLSGGGQGRATATNLGSTLQGAGMVNIPNAAIVAPDLSGYRETLDSEFVAIQIRMAEFNEQINELINSTIAGTFMSLGDAIGNALVNGGNVLGAIGSSLIQSMGRFLSSFGDQLIKFGLASKAFAKLQLSLQNPATTLVSAGAAIAAGLVLKIAGAAVASAGSSFGGGGGGTSSFSGSSATQTSSNVSSSSFSAQRNDEVVFRIAGTDLLGVLRRAENAENRIG